MLHCLLDTYTRNASGADGKKVPLSKDEPVMIIVWTLTEERKRERNWRAENI
jgi:hypothetical protein